MIRCIDRLRILYDLHCVNRFYPPVAAGTAPQHIVLDRAGAKALGVHEGWKRMTRLPLTFRHTVLIADFRVTAWEAGMEWGEREVCLGPIVPDVWFPNRRLAVEVDTGTETQKQLLKKAAGYNRTKVRYLLFATTGPAARAKLFLSAVANVQQRIGVTWDRLNALFQTVKFP